MSWFFYIKRLSSKRFFPDTPHLKSSNSTQYCKDSKHDKVANVIIELILQIGLSKQQAYGNHCQWNSNVKNAGWVGFPIKQFINSVTHDKSPK